MSSYTPDVWILVEIQTPTDTFIKVFASWYGGYLGGDSWKLSSGTERVEQDGDYFVLPQFSGSTYRLHKNGHGASGYTNGILLSLLSAAPSELRALTQEEALEYLNASINSAQTQKGTQ